MNCQKGPLAKNLSKNTISGWRHVWAGDTCRLPPGPKPAGTSRLPQRRHVSWRATPSTVVTSGGPCRLTQYLHAGVARAAWANAGTLPRRFPTLTALIPTLMALIPRRKSCWICMCDDSLHAIWNLCCFYLSIRCFEILFHTVNRL
jgi:hypothetical protein